MNLDRQHANMMTPDADSVKVSRAHPADSQAGR